MSKQPKLSIVGVDEVILPLEKCVFFGRLSDITLLPDWFPEDEEKNQERFKERWRFITGVFPERGLGCQPNQHTKIFLGTDDKRTLYAELKEIKVLISRLSAGLGKLVLCDGYPKAILDSFGWNIVRSVQMKQTNTLENQDKQAYKLMEVSYHHILSGKHIVATSDAQEYNDIENCRVVVRDTCRERGWMFVDMTRGDWVDTYFPELDSLITAQEQYQFSRMGGLGIMSQPVSGNGGGEPPIDGGMLN